MPSTTRQALLQALSAAGGAYISGQQLAGQLGVSRAAVHKAAAALTAQGYALEAVSRRGYRLLGGDPFCAEAVGPYPAPVQVYDTLESSNRTAKLLALDGAPHGTLVLTAHQSAGRGRLGRVFESPSAIMSFTGKIENTFASSIGIAILGVVGYVSHTEGSLIQNHSTNLALFAMTTIVPAIGYLLMLIPIHFYNITGEGHRKMMSDIAERRASIAAETAAEMQSAGETK